MTEIFPSWKAPPLSIDFSRLPALPPIRGEPEELLQGRLGNHREWALAHLGDAVVGSAARRAFFPQNSETRDRAWWYLCSQVVANSTLSFLAVRYQLHAVKNPGVVYSNQKLMADLFEALVGALSLQAESRNALETWLEALFSSVFLDASTSEFKQFSTAWAEAGKVQPRVYPVGISRGTSSVYYDPDRRAQMIQAQAILMRTAPQTMTSHPTPIQNLKSYLWEPPRLRSARTEIG